MPKTIGIIGYGNFGTFVHTLINQHASHADVRVYSREAEIDTQIFFSLTEVCQADVLIVCVPISAYEEVLAEIANLVTPTTVIVDVATVKEYTLKLLQKFLPEQPYIATHPMFGPESYKKKQGDVSGFKLVICEHQLPEKIYQSAIDFLSSLGFVVIEMSANEHDKLLAETLFLTHYIGQTMKAGAFGRTALDTVSFSYLMDAVESVQGDAQLFADVYAHNAHCKEIAERFHQAQKEVFVKIGE